MDRALLGTSPEIESGTSAFYNRAGNTGLFISRPGANVMSCSDGDLIFDSSSPDFIQVLLKGSTEISKAPNSTTPTIKEINTPQVVQYEDNAPTLVTWSLIVPSSNLHPTAFSSSWNTASSLNSFVVVPPYLNLDYINLGDPKETGLVQGFGLSAKTVANTEHSPNTIDIFFTNGSTKKDQFVSWTLYRARGIE